MKNTFRGCLVGVMALLSLMGNAYGWSREEEKKIEDLKCVVLGLRRVKTLDDGVWEKVNGRHKLYSKDANLQRAYERGELAERYQVPLEIKLKALRQISWPRVLADCAFYDATGETKEKHIVLGRRNKEDPVRKEAMKMLMAMPMKKVVDGIFFDRCSGYGYSHYTCWNGLYWCREWIDYAFSTDKDATTKQMFVMCCEEFSKNQKVLFEFFKEYKGYWHDRCKTQRGRDEYEPSLCEYLTEEDQEGLVAFFKDYYQEHWPKKSILLKHVYDLLNNDNKSLVARYAVTYAGSPYDNEKKTDYNWALEAEMIKDNIKVFIKEFGAESGVELPRKAAINKLSFLLRDDEGREPFEGIFGRKFGETIAVDEKCRVRSFGMNFYRVRFEPEKKSQAFADYYLWVSEVTRKVFAIEARSKSALSDVLVTALEKKYKTRFANSGQYYEMLFPKEACSFKMFKNISYSGSSDGYGAGLFAAMIFNSDFGNSILRQTGDEIEKRKRSVKNYIFTQADRQSGGVAVAESIELFAMAKRESQIAETEREKEAQLRKKLEADNAADAF